LTIYPGAIDNTTSLPLVVDTVTPVAAVTVNRLRTAIIAVQNELGVTPSGSYSTVVARINNIDSQISSGVTPSSHASTHEDGGSDEIDIQNLGSGSAVINKVVVTDGAGGLTLEDYSGGGGGISGSGTDNNVARWDGTSALQDSGVAIDDSDNMTIGGDLTIEGSGSLFFNTGAGPVSSLFIINGNYLSMGSSNASYQDVRIIEHSSSNNILIGNSNANYISMTCTSGIEMNNALTIRDSLYVDSATATENFIDLDNGVGAAVSASGHIRVRNNGGAFEVSENGGAYFAINSHLTGSGTDNNIVRWDGTSAAQDSSVSIDDSGNTNFGSGDIIFGTVGSEVPTTGDFRTPFTFTWKSYNPVGRNDVLISTLDSSSDLYWGDSSYVPNSYIDAFTTVNLRVGGTTVVGCGSAALGFYNTTPASQQTVTGSKGGNVALGNLLTALATLGLIVDSTT